MANEFGAKRRNLLRFLARAHAPSRPRSVARCLAAAASLAARASSAARRFCFSSNAFALSAPLRSCVTLECACVTRSRKSSMSSELGPEDMGTAARKGMCQCSSGEMKDAVFVRFVAKTGRNECFLNFGCNLFIAAAAAAPPSTDHFHLPIYTP